jgi:hypothetical protein
MKAFKDYLTEGKRAYPFRVRIADVDIDSDMLDRIERGLAQFELAEISKPKTQPVARTAEFQALGPVARTQFEVVLNYPTNPDGVRYAIHHACGIPPDNIVVRYPGQDDLVDELEEMPKHTPSGNALLVDGELGDADTDHQEHVGEKRVFSLLKSLEATKHGAEQYKGVNDQLLAASAPGGDKPKTTSDDAQGNTSPVAPRPKRK